VDPVPLFASLRPHVAHGDPEPEEKIATKGGFATFTESPISDVLAEFSPAP